MLLILIRSTFQGSFKYWFVSIKLKKGNIVPIHKKDDKQILKNYCPVSLLPICGKIFERLIFDELFNFLLENNLISPNQSGFNLISPNQSGFKPGDSCINQLLSITQNLQFI